MTLTEISIKRPSLIIVLFTVLIGAGVFSLAQLGYEILPRFSPKLLTIRTLYPGAAPSEVESQVNREIEDAISEVEYVSSISSSSFESLSLITVEFAEAANLDVVKQDVTQRLQSIQSKLPADAETPSVSELSFNDFPVLRIGATSSLPPTEFYDLLDNRIVPELSQVEGVGNINLVGGQQREIRVSVDPDRLQHHNLSLFQVTDAINNANLEFPTGRLENGQQELLVRLGGRFTSVDQIKEVVVFTPPNGGPVRVKDVAKVADTAREINTLNRVNGVNSVGVEIQKKTDANAVAVSDLARARLSELEKRYGNINLKFNVAVDTSRFTLQAAEAVGHDLILAVFLVAVVMLLFLHSLRSAFIVLVAIPCSLLSAMTILYVLGYTLNLMTLLAMTLVIGILVDDSIVVLENIFRHLAMGKDRRRAALDGRNEIGFTAVSITLVDVVVFSPFILISSTTGNLIKPFAVMVVTSTLLSLLVCFTVTPWLASRFAKEEHPSGKGFFGRIGLWFENGLTSITNSYGGLLGWSLRHRGVVAILTVVLLAGAVSLPATGFIGSEFVAEGDKGEFVVRLEFDKGTSFERNNLVTLQVENYLLNQPPIRTVFANVGSTTSIEAALSGSNQSEITIQLVPADQRDVKTRRYLLDVQRELSKRFSGVKITTVQTSIFGGNSADPIQILLSSDSQQALDQAADKVEKIVLNTPGAIDVKRSVEEGSPELRVDIDRNKIARLGLNVSTVGATLQTALAGNDRAKYREGGDEYDIRIILDAFDRRDIRDVSNLTFLNNRGQLIYLNQFAAITNAVGSSKLERRDRRGAITISSQVQGSPSGTVAALIREQMAGAGLPGAVNVVWIGDQQRQGEAFKSLGLALIAGILLVYLIMVALYDSFLYPFVVLFSIPVAAVGAFLALALAQSTLSIFTGLGLITLIGLVAKNAILLVDFTNQRKAEGLSTADALIDAGKARLRPILMTTLALVFGMIPVAIASGAGSEWKNGLGWVLIGGLTSSMFLTLVLVPVVYLTVDRLKARTSGLFSRRRSSPAVHPQAG